MAKNQIKSEVGVKEAVKAAGAIVGVGMACGLVLIGAAKSVGDKLFACKDASCGVNKSSEDVPKFED